MPLAPEICLQSERKKISHMSKPVSKKALIARVKEMLHELLVLEMRARASGNQELLKKIIATHAKCEHLLAELTRAYRNNVVQIDFAKKKTAS